MSASEILGVKGLELLKMGVEIVSTLDLDQVLEKALVKAETLCAADASSIWEVDDAEEGLYLRLVRGKEAPKLRDIFVNMGEGIVGNVALSQKAEIVSNVPQDKRWLGRYIPLESISSILTVPLVAAQKSVGVIQLIMYGDKRFTDEDLELISLLSAPIAAAMANARLYAKQRALFAQTISSLAEAVERRDPYTGGHTKRVLYYSLVIGKFLGLSVDELKELYVAAVLHDIGKIAVPDKILQKPAPLSRDEFDILTKHPVDGATIIANISGMDKVVEAVKYHHERFDGKGYPDRLKGENIPLLARIIAVADTFDAMTTDRPYRKALSFEEAVKEIERFSGTQFCPNVVRTFKEAYNMGKFKLEEGKRIAEILFPESEKTRSN